MAKSCIVYTHIKLIIFLAVTYSKNLHFNLCFLFNYFKIVNSLFLRDVFYMSDSLPWSSFALLGVGWLAGLLCTFGSCPTRFLFGGHQKHFTLIARRALIQCNLFVCLFASLPAKEHRDQLFYFEAIKCNNIVPINKHLFIHR